MREAKNVLLTIFFTVIAIMGGITLYWLSGIFTVSTTKTTNQDQPRFNVTKSESELAPCSLSHEYPSCERLDIIISQNKELINIETALLCTRMHPITALEKYGVNCR